MWRVRSAARLGLAGCMTRFISRSIATGPVGIADRHVGPRDKEVEEMLRTVGMNSLEEFTSAVVPSQLLWKPSGPPVPPMDEQQVLSTLKRMAMENKQMKSFIGQGYYGTVTPAVILRSVLENPTWYTSYTPYQAEISQGRLEALLVYQTMVVDLTGLSVANASLLDEGSSAAEAVSLCLRSSGGVVEGKARKVFVADDCHPHIIEVARCRCDALGVELVVGDVNTFDPVSCPVAGVIVQYPSTNGVVRDYTNLFRKVAATGAYSVIAGDLLSMVMLKSPGEMGADIAFGSSQRFGCPMGCGGPHAAFFAASNRLVRQLPGRIIGVSKDSRGEPALRMTLQTREQHIKRERATSNICTSQSLMADMAGLYAVWHGPDGLRNIAQRVHLLARALAQGLGQAGHVVSEEPFFDTVKVQLCGISAKEMVDVCAFSGINIRRVSDTEVCIALDETTTEDDVSTLLHCSAEQCSGQCSSCGFHLETGDLMKSAGDWEVLKPSILRKSKILKHRVFNSCQSEVAMQRYLHQLAKRDVGLDTSPIPLGSCTMKLNPAVTMLPISWPEWNIHPFAPPEQAKGYERMLSQLRRILLECTGMDELTFQPNSGAQGEYTGLRVITSYHRSRGEGHRDLCLIPESAHGTNPASAAVSGHRVVVVACKPNGDVDVEDMERLCAKHAHELSCAMITYPSTHGVFEAGIARICDVVHKHGGQLYLDGANMNAQVYLCNPGDYGVDVIHLNLHKSFAMPHGGGGPGAAPLLVRKHLAPHLPSHFSDNSFGDSRSCGQITSARWGSVSILPICLAYLLGMGTEGLRYASQMALLNANYVAKRLQKAYRVLYTSSDGWVAHEFILDVRPFKTLGIEAEDVAKRLMDYGLHAPTLSFPVAGTLMIEPTESEPKDELDRMVDALLCIREEIAQIERGEMDRKDNPLKNSPHTADMEKAAFSSVWHHLSQGKWWPSVGRVNNVFGDRNFRTTCHEGCGPLSRHTSAP